MAYAHELSRAFFYCTLVRLSFANYALPAVFFITPAPLTPSPSLSPHRVCMCICIVAAGEFVKYLPDFSKNAKFVAI